ncbi:hypothetical protein ACFPRL_31005 [Pseudoclavibacter helvolus]
MRPTRPSSATRSRTCASRSCTSTRRRASSSSRIGRSACSWADTGDRPRLRRGLSGSRMDGL